MSRSTTQHRQTRRRASLSLDSVANALSGIPSTLKIIASSAASKSPILESDRTDRLRLSPLEEQFAPSTHGGFCRQIPTSTEILIPKNVDMSHILVDFRSTADTSDDSSSVSSSSCSSFDSSDSDSISSYDSDDYNIDIKSSSVCPNSEMRKFNWSRPVNVQKPKFPRRYSTSSPTSTEENANNPFAGGFSFATSGANTPLDNSMIPKGHTARPEDSPFKNISFQRDELQQGACCLPQARSQQRKPETSFLPSSRLPSKLTYASLEVPTVFLDDSDNGQGKKCNGATDFEPSVGGILKGGGESMLLAALQDIAKDMTEQFK